MTGVFKISYPLIPTIILYSMPVAFFLIFYVFNKIKNYCKSLERKIDALESIIKETDEHVDRLIFYSIDKDVEN